MSQEKPMIHIQVRVRRTNCFSYQQTQIIIFIARKSHSATIELRIRQILSTPIPNLHKLLNLALLINCHTYTC